MIRFVRQLRLAHWKRGLAVDRSGKRWRGFSSGRTGADVLHSGFLGGVGLCSSCGDRVFEGWECIDSRKDLCDGCALLPDHEHVFVVETGTEREWRKLRKEFFRHGNFGHQRRNKNSGGSSS